MVRVLGTRRPGRVDKGVMEKLLNVVNNPLFEVFWFISEHSNAGNRLFYRGFVATPNGLREIMGKQANHTLGVRP